MCPSYRVTRDERDVTRGRANTLRLAITGQLGPDALTSDEMAETLKLCVSCKACRRECPTGVDMARMKIEVLRARTRKIRAVAARPPGRLSAALRALRGAKLSWLLNLRDVIPGAANCRKRIAGFSAQRQPAELALGLFRRNQVAGKPAGQQVAKSSCSPTPSIAISSAKISTPRSRCSRAAGYRVTVATPADGARPLCCGRTFLSVGKVDEARREAERTLAALAPFAAARYAGHRTGAELPVQLPRRNPGADQERYGAPGRQPCAAVRGIFGARGRRGEAQPAARADEKAGAPARPLPSEIVRHDGRGRGDAEAHSRSRRRDHRIELLRHGRRLRLSCRHDRGVARHGRAVAAARRAQSARRTPSSSPTARPAGIRSRTAPGARRCMSRACWR